MTWEKTWFSYILWALYSVIICTALGMGAFVLLSPILQPVMIIGVVCLFLLVWTAIWFGIQYLTGKVKDKAKTGCKGIGLIIIEIFFIALIAFLGIYLHNVLIEQIDVTLLSQTSYLQQSFVDDMSVISKTEYGAEWLFLLALRCVFFVVGNHAEAALWLVVVIQLLAGFVFSRGIRRVTGAAWSTVAFAAFEGIAILMFMLNPLNPACVSVLLFAFALCGVINIFANRTANVGYGKPGMVAYYIWLMILGAYISAVIYIDNNAVILCLPVISLLWCGNDRLAVNGTKVPNVYLQVLFTLLGIGTGLGLLNFWSPIVLDVNLLFFEQTEYNEIILFVALCVILYWGCLNFLKEKVKNSYDGIFLMVLGAVSLRIVGLNVTAIHNIWLFYLLLFGALYCLGKTFSLYIIDANVVSEDVNNEDANLNNSEIRVEEKMEQIGAEIVKSEDEPAIKFLEAPLPGPKKHVPRTLDYDLKEEDMSEISKEYDIEVSDNDDYDLL